MSKGVGTLGEAANHDLILRDSFEKESKGDSVSNVFQKQLQAQMAEQARREAEQDDEFRALAENRAQLIEEMSEQRKEIELMRAKVDALLKKGNNSRAAEITEKSLEAMDLPPEGKVLKDAPSREVLLKSEVEKRPKTDGVSVERKEINQARKDAENGELVQALNESADYLKSELQQTQEELEQMNYELDLRAKNLRGREISQINGEAAGGTRIVLWGIAVVTIIATTVVGLGKSFFVNTKG